MVKKSNPEKERSDKQRKYYFGCVVEKALEYYKDNPLELVRDVMDSVKADWTKDFVHELFKMKFNHGQTTNFKTDEYEKGTVKAENYNLKIRHHFDAKNFHIAEPNETQWDY